eukprot:g5313.t1
MRMRKEDIPLSWITVPEAEASADASPLARNVCTRSITEEGHLIQQQPETPLHITAPTDDDVELDSGEENVTARIKSELDTLDKIMWEKAEAMVKKEDRYDKSMCKYRCQMSPSTPKFWRQCDPRRKGNGPCQCSRHKFQDLIAHEDATFPANEGEPIEEEYRKRFVEANEKNTPWSCPKTGCPVYVVCDACNESCRQQAFMQCREHWGCDGTDIVPAHFASSDPRDRNYKLTEDLYSPRRASDIYLPLRGGLFKFKEACEDLQGLSKEQNWSKDDWELLEARNLCTNYKASHYEECIESFLFIQKTLLSSCRTIGKTRFAKVPWIKPTDDYWKLICELDERGDRVGGASFKWWKKHVAAGWSRTTLHPEHTEENPKISKETAKISFAWEIERRTMYILNFYRPQWISSNLRNKLACAPSRIHVTRPSMPPTVVKPSMHATVVRKPSLPKPSQTTAPKPLPANVEPVHMERGRRRPSRLPPIPAAARGHIPSDPDAARGTQGVLRRRLLTNLKENENNRLNAFSSIEAKTRTNKCYIHSDIGNLGSDTVENSRIPLVRVIACTHKKDPIESVWCLKQLVDSGILNANDYSIIVSNLHAYWAQKQSVVCFSKNKLKKLEAFMRGLEEKYVTNSCIKWLELIIAEVGIDPFTDEDHHAIGKLYERLYQLCPDFANEDWEENRINGKWITQKKWITPLTQRGLDKSTLKCIVEFYKTVKLDFGKMMDVKKWKLINDKAKEGDLGAVGVSELLLIYQSWIPHIRLRLQMNIEFMKSLITQTNGKDERNQISKTKVIEHLLLLFLQKYFEPTLTNVNKALDDVTEIIKKASFLQPEEKIFSEKFTDIGPTQTLLEKLKNYLYETLDQYKMRHFLWDVPSGLGEESDQIKPFWSFLTLTPDIVDGVEWAVVSGDEGVKVYGEVDNTLGASTFESWYLDPIQQPELESTPEATPGQDDHGDVEALSGREDDEFRTMINRVSDLLPDHLTQEISDNLWEINHPTCEDVFGILFSQIADLQATFNALTTVDDPKAGKNMHIHIAFDRPASTWTNCRYVDSSTNIGGCSELYQRSDFDSSYYDGYLLSEPKSAVISSGLSSPSRNCKGGTCIGNRKCAKQITLTSCLENVEMNCQWQKNTESGEHECNIPIFARDNVKDIERMVGEEGKNQILPLYDTLYTDTPWVSYIFPNKFEGELEDAREFYSANVALGIMVTHLNDLAALSGDLTNSLRGKTGKFFSVWSDAKVRQLRRAIINGFYEEVPDTNGPLGGMPRYTDLEINQVVDMSEKWKITNQFLFCSLDRDHEACLDDIEAEKNGHNWGTFKKSYVAFRTMYGKSKIGFEVRRFGLAGGYLPQVLRDKMGIMMPPSASSTSGRSDDGLTASLLTNGRSTTEYGASTRRRFQIVTWRILEKIHNIADALSSMGTRYSTESDEHQNILDLPFMLGGIGKTLRDIDVYQRKYRKVGPDFFRLKETDCTDTIVCWKADEKLFVRTARSLYNYMPFNQEEFPGRKRETGVKQSVQPHTKEEEILQSFQNQFFPKDLIIFTMKVIAEKKWPSKHCENETMQAMVELFSFSNDKGDRERVFEKNIRALFRVLSATFGSLDKAFNAGLREYEVPDDKSLEKEDYERWGKNAEMTHFGENWKPVMNQICSVPIAVKRDDNVLIIDPQHAPDWVFVQRFPKTKGKPWKEKPLSEGKQGIIPVSSLGLRDGDVTSLSEGQKKRVREDFNGETGGFIQSKYLDANSAAKELCQRNNCVRSGGSNIYSGEVVCNKNFEQKVEDLGTCVDELWTKWSFSFGIGRLVKEITSRDVEVARNDLDQRKNNLFRIPGQRKTLINDYANAKAAATFFGLKSVQECELGSCAEMLYSFLDELEIYAKKETHFLQ